MQVFRLADFQTEHKHKFRNINIVFLSLIQFALFMNQVGEIGRVKELTKLSVVEIISSRNQRVKIPTSILGPGITLLNA